MTLKRASVLVLAAGLLLSTVFLIIHYLSPAAAEPVGGNFAEYAIGEDMHSNWLTIDVPPGAIAFLITVEGIPGVGYSLSDLVAPSGRVLLPGVLVRTGGWTGYNYLYPNVPDLPIDPGRYRFRIESNRPSHPVKVAVHVKDSTPEHSGGTIHLNVYRVTNLDDVTEFPTTQMLADLSSVFNTIGLKFHVAHTEIGRDVGPLDPSQKDPTPLTKVAEGRGVRNGVNVFIVDTLRLAHAYTFTTPGPATSDLSSSGIVIDVNWIEHLPHEIGHYLGLFHISDVPIPDTNCVNCPKNLMDTGWPPGTHLSPGQISVILRHPIIQTEP